MADVTGRIGNEEVELNNAATEATLKMLLQATLASAKGSKEELNKVAAMAAKAGLDSDSIEQTNKAVQATTPQMNALGKTAFVLGAAFGAAERDFQTLVKTGQQLAAGTAQASDVLSNMATMLPGPLGKVVQGFAALASFQEGMLTQYQGLTKAGVNFGGSLTDLRMAASNSYLTMQEFSTLMSSNSATLAKMGGSVDAGARAFSAASNTLGASKLGSDLRALGYTSLEVNQGMMDYINISGGRNRKEMQDTEALAKGAGQYMEQLDGLAKLTGESREALAAKMKEDAANQAWQGYLLTLDVKDREKASAARLEAEARGGKGAADALQAKLMGLPPMTEAGQKFVGTMQNGNKAIDGLASNVKDTSKTIDDVKKSGAGFSAGLAEDGRNLKQVASAQIMAGKDVELFGKALGAANAATRNGVKSAEEQYAFEQKISKEAAAQKESEAKAAVESKKALEELGQGILKMVMPFVKMLLPVVNALAPLAPAIMAAVTAFVALKGAMAAKALLGGGGGGIPGLPGGGGGVPDGAAGGLGGMGAAMKGAAGGLRAFANPMVLAGAAGFGVAIAAIGAGIAGAAWLMGKALPTLAEGLMKFTEIDGGKLGAAAFGVAKLGVGLLPLAPFAIWGLPAAFAMNQLADGVGKLAAIDPGRLEKVAAGMEKIKAATPTVGESIRAGIAGLVGKVTGTANAAEAPAGAAPAAGGGGADLNILVNEMKRLNTVSSDMLKFLKETADQTRRTADATKALNGDQFRF
jgi:hypothetical protein